MDRKVPEELTRDELAAKLRPVSLYKELEYTLKSAEDYCAIADAALNMKGKVHHPIATTLAPEH